VTIRQGQPRGKPLAKKVVRHTSLAATSFRGNSNGDALRGGSVQSKMLATKPPCSLLPPEDGEEAHTRLLAGEKCSIILTDLHMARVDGDELLRRVRANPSMKDIPVIVLTGSSEADMEADLIDAGADDYIRKPIQSARLVARVRAALRRSAA
jgi:CheY-like chemotaxis protein